MSTLDDKRIGARRSDLECTVHPYGSLGNYMFVVVVAEYEGRLLLSRHKKRDTWETQGGHVEAGETPMDAARRELAEESGAVKFDIFPVCDYYGYNKYGSANGAVFRAEIYEMGELPESEMAETRLFDEIPDGLTYPNVTPKLIEEARMSAKRG